MSSTDETPVTDEVTPETAETTSEEVVVAREPDPRCFRERTVNLARREQGRERQLTPNPLGVRAKPLAERRLEHPVERPDIDDLANAL